MCQNDVTMKNLSIYFVNIIIIVLFINLCNGQLPDNLICASPKCDVVISRAVTNVLYTARSKDLLSFRPNVQVKVFSKSKDLWGVDIQGRRGFVPKHLITETQILVRSQDLIEVTAESLVANTLLPNNPDQVTPPQNENNNRINTINPNVGDNIGAAKIFTADRSSSEEEAKTTTPTDPIATNAPIDKLTGLEPENTIAAVSNANTQENKEKTEQENIYDSSEEISIDDEDDYEEEDDVEEVEEDIEDDEEVVESNENVNNLDKNITTDNIENFIPNTKTDETQINNSTKLSENSENVSISTGKENIVTQPEEKTTENIEKKLSESAKTSGTIEPVEKLNKVAMNNEIKTTQDSPQLPPINNEIETNNVKLDNSNKLTEPKMTSAFVSDEPITMKIHDHEKREAEITAGKKVDDIQIINNSNILSANNEDADTRLNEEIKTEKPDEKVLENKKINLSETVAKTTDGNQIHVINESNNVFTDLNQPIISTNNKISDSNDELNENTTMKNMKEEIVEKLDETKSTTRETSDNIHTMEQHSTRIHNEGMAKDSNNQPPYINEINNQFAPQLDISKSDDKAIITEDNTLMPEIINNHDKLTTVIPETAKEIPQPPIDDYFTTPSPYIQNPIEVPLNEVVSDNIEKPTNPLNNIINNMENNEQLNTIVEKTENVGVGSIEEVGTQQIQTETVEEVNNTQSNVNEVENNSEETTGGFFSNLFNKFFGNSESNESKENIIENPDDFSRTLEEVLYANPNKNNDKINIDDDLHKKNQIADSGFCENLSPNSCPKAIENNHMSSLKHPMVQHLHHANINVDDKQITYNIDTYIEHLLAAVLDMTDLLMYLVISGFTILLFILGHYYLEKSRKEAPLLAKINELERSLMVSSKDCAIKENELIDIKSKLNSIENNSFGSNEMVIDLKRKLEDSDFTKCELQEQIVGLEKELENAAEAGLELNKMVSELLSSQSGSDSIISSVEELQKQLNEQQETILSINTTLAEKSRENSELQVLLSEQCGKFGKEFQELERNYEELKTNKKDLEAELLNTTETLEMELKKINDEKSHNFTRLTKDLSTLQIRCETLSNALRKSESKVQSLEDCLKDIKGSNRGEFKELMDIANLRADLLALSKEKETFKDGLENEIDARKLLEDHVKTVTEEMSKLKQEFNQAEKDKLEAETRLEVLSTYFNNKETQLQKELSIKEAMWMQQQGETTTTVERIRLLQEELQVLKSQNDALRAENEAQSQAHKAQIGILESRAHESWLTARQAERRFDEARSESSALRRKLTSMAENPLSGDNNMANRSQNAIHDGLLNDINVPAPLRIDSPNSPLMGVLPPPPFLPPPFMPPPHPFAPPPFMPGPGEMRPPPLGRVMSPPPLNRYSPNIVDNRDRYTPERGGGRYTPDSRYEYAMSPYETETDFSPPPSPEPRKGYRDRGGYKAYSPPPDSRSKRSKGGLSSGSVDSLGPRKGGKG